MPSSITRNRNIVVGAETKLVIYSKRFAYTSGTVRIVERLHDSNDSENEIFTFTTNSRFTMFVDIEFQEEVGVPLHDLPIASGVGIFTTDYLRIELYTLGLGYPPYLADIKVEEFSLTPNPKEGGPVMGRLRGESLGSFTMPTEIFDEGITPDRFGSPAADPGAIV